MEANLKDGPLSQNRAEEFGYDLWENFVVPPYYDRLDLRNAKKPRVVIGGRGCGKTMLLRYICHQTAFSSKRQDIEKDALKHIGLYWRVDTQFASLMAKRGKDDAIWTSAFEHMATLLVCNEILKSLDSIVDSNLKSVSRSDLQSLDFRELSAYDPLAPVKEGELRIYLKMSLGRFTSWIKNINTIQQPVFLSQKFAVDLIQILRNQIAPLLDSTFFVYIDEFENLMPLQQEVVNTWLKHSESPLIYNLAMKRNAFQNRRTLGTESLSEIHDFRMIDLEAFYDEEFSFELFAAEILGFRLRAYEQDAKMFPDIAILRDPKRISEREAGDYRKIVKDYALSVFPETTEKELAQLVLADGVLRKKLYGLIAGGLENKHSTIKPDVFMDDRFPEATIVTFCLLYRGKNNPENILAEFNKLKNGHSNKFTGSTDWIHNNFIGCLLLIYASVNRPCLFYSGFGTFCKLSSGNIRHLMELAHKSVLKALINQDNIPRQNKLVVTPTNQAEAAKQASSALLNEIRTFGRFGNKLHTLVLRLGAIFNYAHSRLTQSEPEQNHFAITSGRTEVSKECGELLLEAVKWSVFSEQKSTKHKGDLKLDSQEYVLNPIYAPFFHISYRKRRRIELSADEFMTISNGSIDDFQKLLKKYRTAWSTTVRQPESLFLSGFELD